MLRIEQHFARYALTETIEHAQKTGKPFCIDAELCILRLEAMSVAMLPPARAPKTYDKATSYQDIAGRPCKLARGLHFANTAFRLRFEKTTGNN
jgi:hypothetical protein